MKKVYLYDMNKKGWIIGEQIGNGNFADFVKDAFTNCSDVGDKNRYMVSKDNFMKAIKILKADNVLLEFYNSHINSFNLIKKALRKEPIIDLAVI